MIYNLLRGAEVGSEELDAFLASQPHKGLHVFLLWSRTSALPISNGVTCDSA